MLQGSNHVTDQHPIGQEAKIPTTTSHVHLNVEMASLSLCRSLVQRIHPPHATLIPVSFVITMIIIVSRGLIELTCAKG